MLLTTHHPPNNACTILIFSSSNFNAPHDDANNGIANHHDANGFVEGSLGRDPRERNARNASLDNETTTTTEATTPSGSPAMTTTRTSTIVARLAVIYHLQ